MCRGQRARQRVGETGDADNDRTPTQLMELQLYPGGGCAQGVDLGDVHGDCVIPRGRTADGALVGLEWLLVAHLHMVTIPAQRVSGSNLDSELRRGSSQHEDDFSLFKGHVNRSAVNYTCIARPRNSGKSHDLTHESRCWIKHHRRPIKNVHLQRSIISAARETHVVRKYFTK